MAEKLGTYKGKRRFEDTPEPVGADGPEAPDELRFVVQEHHATRLHWDLRLERDGVLVSWAVPNGIPEDPDENRKAVHTEDHPLEYLDFEGEIPAGNYGAGTMRVWDRGTYVCEKWQPRKVIVSFLGERLRGRYALFQTGAEGKDWMIHRMDPPEDPDREPMPERLVPMLARPSTLPRDEGNWAFEIKWDGIRALAYSQPGRLRLESRNGNDLTAQYPELRPMNRALSSHSAVLDGEIVAFDAEGRPSFQRLQKRMHQTSESVIRRRAAEVPVVYLVFDLLWLDGHSLLHLPYRERRERLEALGLEGPAWRTPEYHAGNGKALLDAAAAQGLEGVVAKRLDSRYEPGGRGGAWLKVKNHQRQELVVAGWEPGAGRRRDGIGALLVGYHDPSERDEEGRPALRYAGKVGTGFADADLDALQKLLEQRRRKTSPFAGAQPGRKAVFAEPDLVAEIEFTEWTDENLIRHPSFKGLRDDKSPLDVAIDRAEEPVATPPSPGPPAVPESKTPALQALAGENHPLTGSADVVVENRDLRLSNLDKVLYPKAGFTKGQVIDYYARIAPVLLPHLRGRPLTLKRYPNGVESKHFYEKQCPKHRPDWVETAPIWSRHRNKTIEYCLASNLPTLVWTANLADLELHTSLSLSEEILRPTILAFDLDPGPPASIIECCRVALWLRAMFDQLGLAAFPKTSGSKGLQVYVPLNSETSYDETKPFAKAVAEALEQGYPDLVVSRMTKSLREGKVLVDWSQNDDSKTTVCVYSLRAKDRPTVSTPLSWEEVEQGAEAEDPELLAFDSDQVLARVAERGDLFAPVVSLVQELPRFGA